MKLCRLENCENYIYCEDDKKGVCGLDENYLVDDMTECYEDIETIEESVIMYIEAKKETEYCTLALKCPYGMNPIGCESGSGDSICGGFMGTKEIDGILFVQCRGVY